MQQRQGWKRTDFFKLETTKDGPVVEANALETYPNSVHLYITSLVTVLVQTTFCGLSIKPIEASGFAYKSQCLLFILPSSLETTLSS